MSHANLADCIAWLEDMINTMDAQLEYHSKAYAILELMLRTDALYMPKAMLYSLILGLSEYVNEANKLNETSLNFAIRMAKNLREILPTSFEPTKH